MPPGRRKPPAIPRIMVAGTHSGCGKTTVSRGLMQALRRIGLVVQPFKVGPDFIDPTHHTAICGRISRNLDPFMMGEEGVLATFHSASAGADIAVIEGVMGMYDGLEGTSMASTAHVMRILRAPALLVVDVKAMSRSAHAVIKGYRTFEPGINLGGVIFNRVGSPRHRAMIEEGLSFRSLGFIPHTPGLGIESRHLGLKMAFEMEADPLPGTVVLEHCDVDGILEIARSAPFLPAVPVPPPLTAPDVTIGVAQDEAFCFYYQDNLECLGRAGARIKFFSPLRDPLPEANGYYFGGGYPELHAAALERAPCRTEIRSAAEKGIPVTYPPSPNTGGGGPVSLAGAIALGNAECLVGLLLTQLVRPGTPFLYGMNTAALDMKSAIVSYGAPEWPTGMPAWTELGRYYNLPVWGAAGATDSKVVDAQAGIEATVTIMSAFLSRCNLVHDVGYIKYGSTSSMEMLVICDEIIRDVRWFMDGVEVSERTLAREAIHRVRAGSGFLADDHTLDNWRWAQWRPMIIDRSRYDRWVSDGCKDMAARANDRARQILATHVVPPLPLAAEDEITDILQRRAREREA